MSVNYLIQADVVDLRSDLPQKDDRFLVDTNVWFWMTYSRASQAPITYQARTYPSYARMVRAAGGKLYRCNLSFAELAHAIERDERTVFNRTRAAGTTVETKEFRHNYPTERSNVLAEIQSAWGLVKTLALPLEVSIDESTTDVALQKLSSVRVDGYDLFILEAMTSDGIGRIVTDDGDFTTVPGIQVFTANSNVINLAKSQGRLIVR